MSEIYQEEKTSLKDTILSIKQYFKYLGQKWYWILIGILLSAGLALFVHTQTALLNVAKYTFVLEEGGTPAGGGALSNLGLGGANQSGASLFQTDNLIHLYSSKLLLQNSLLSEVPNMNGKIFYDWFFEVDPIANEAVRDGKIKRIDIPANQDRDKLSIQQMGMLDYVTNNIKSRYLLVNTVPNTVGIIEVVVTGEHELFAYEFNKQLVNDVNNFYIEYKTQKSAKKVQELQAKANEYDAELNKSMVQTATSIDAIPFPNPSMQSAQVKPQRESVDVSVITQLYSQTTASLEQAKLELARETPLIKTIDAPTLPLPKSRPNRMLYIIIGAIAGLIITVSILVLKKYYKNIMAEEQK